MLCHNPVTVDDHPACGALGLAPRLGDIRYNTVLNIPDPQTPSAWGIMVDADDPLTGEKVAASINIWTAVTDIASQQLTDLVKYVNGELTTADITNGSYISNWAQAAKLAGGGASPTMTKAQIHQRLAAGSGVSTQAYETAVASKLAPGLQSAVQQFYASNVMDVAIDNTVPSPSAAAINARFQAMHNSTTEAPLLNAAMMQRAGISSQIPVGSVADQVSPMALGNPRVTSQFTQLREQAMASKGYCLLQDAPEMSSLTGIADAMKRKFPKAANENAEATTARYNAMLSYIRRRYHYAVLAHEMGHSVGLRHNFVSTYAALHYRPQYWQLRTSNGKQVTACTDAVADGSTCTGPRYWDPLTEEEQSQMIWMFMQSTVMDYPGDVSQDTIGLGAYDFAAARMFYGDVASVYNVQTAGKLDPSYLSSSPIGQGMLATTDNFGGLTGIQYTLGTQGSTPFHYSQLQANYKLINNCQTVPAPTAPEWWRTDVDGVWDPLFDGHVVTVGGKPSKCRTLPVDYMGWTQLRMPTTGEAGGFYRGGNAVDPATRRVRVPYSFASDNWADIGNVSVFRHDNGADPYEQVQFLITTQEDRHILDNFRRGRSTFTVRAAGDRSYSRYNEKMYGIANGVGFLANIYKDLANSSGVTFDSFWPYIIENNFKDNMIGATLAFDHFTRELSRPESGGHYFGAFSQSSGLPPGMQDNVLRSANDSDGLVLNNGNVDPCSSCPRARRATSRHRDDPRAVVGSTTASAATCSRTAWPPTRATTTSTTRGTAAPTTTRSTPRSSSPSPKTASSASPGKTSTTPASAPSAWPTSFLTATAASSPTPSPATAPSWRPTWSRTPPATRRRPRSRPRGAPTRTPPSTRRAPSAGRAGGRARAPRPASPPTGATSASATTSTSPAAWRPRLHAAPPPRRRPPPSTRRSAGRCRSSSSPTPSPTSPPTSRRTGST